MNLAVAVQGSTFFGQTIIVISYLYMLIPLLFHIFFICMISKPVQSNYVYGYRSWLVPYSDCRQLKKSIQLWHQIRFKVWKALRTPVCRGQAAAAQAAAEGAPITLRLRIRRQSGLWREDAGNDGDEEAKDCPRSHAQNPGTASEFLWSLNRPKRRKKKEPSHGEGERYFWQAKDWRKTWISCMRQYFWRHNYFFLEIMSPAKMF